MYGPIAVNCGVAWTFFLISGYSMLCVIVRIVCTKPALGVVLLRIWFWSLTLWPFGLIIVIFIIVIRYLFIVGYVHGLSITQSGGL